MREALGSTDTGGVATSLERQAVTFMDVAESRRMQLLWLAQRMTNNREDAEDVVQEALLKAFKNLGHFRGDSQMGTWMAVIVRNTGLEWLRKRKRGTWLPLEEMRGRDEEPQALEIPDPASNPEERCAHEEMAGIMLAEMDALDSVCKSALEMCVLGELSHMEAARVLGVNAFTIKSRIFHGKRMLRRAVGQRLRGGEPTAAEMGL